MTRRRVNVLGISSSAFDKKEYEACRGCVSFRLNQHKATDIAIFEGINSRTLPSRQQDFMDIATSIFIADQLIARNPFTGDRWVSVAIPVRDIVFWKTQEDRVSTICEFLSGNNFRVYFYRSESEVLHEKSNETLEGDLICCFSGGLDSLAGAYKELKQGSNVVLASVQHSPTTRATQDRLRTQLETEFGAVPRAVFRFRKKSHYPEHTMHTRSFLYLTAASVLAWHIGASKVLIPENGILALNLPLSDGTLMTRTVHPAFLGQYEKLLESVTGTPISVENPFQYTTKSEVVSILRANPELIRLSNSCWQSWTTRMIARRLRRRAAEHCGYCYPCLVRRLSVDALGLGEYDAGYVVDLYKDLTERIETKTELRYLQLNLLSLVLFCRRINSLDPRSLRIAFPEFEEGTSTYEIDKAIEMYRRFGSEVCRVLSRGDKSELSNMAHRFCSQAPSFRKNPC